MHIFANCVDINYLILQLYFINQRINLKILSVSIMKLYKYIRKSFINSKILFTLYILFFGISVIYSCYYFRFSGDMLVTNKMLPVLSILSYAFFIFLSFEFCRKSKNNNLEECLLTTSDGYKKVIKAQIVLLNNLIIYFFMYMLFLQYSLYIKCGYKFHLQYIIYIFFYTVLNYYLIPLTGTIIGVYLSLTSNRLNSYLLLVLMTLLGTQLFRDFLGMIYDTTFINIFPFFNAFDIFTHDTYFRPFHEFSESLLPNRWFACLFWCVLLSSLIFYKVSVPKNKKTFQKRIPAIIISILFLISVTLPSSKVLVWDNNPYESTESDDTNYRILKLYTSREKNADFTVLSYDAELTIFNRLYAKVTLTLDKTNLDEYIFTLYHQYKIIKITDENKNKLKFQQDGDYVTVYNTGEIKELCFTYVGFSGTYYSNVQGTFLPASFPYLPHAGWHEVYDGWSHDIFYFNDSTDINMKVNSLQKIYCNLEETGRNTFSGKSNGVSLISGFYEEFESDGIRVVRPYMDLEEPDDTILKMIKHNKDSGLFKDGETVLIIPDVNLSSGDCYAEFDDHILTSQALKLL